MPSPDFDESKSPSPARKRASEGLGYESLDCKSVAEASQAADLAEAVWSDNRVVPEHFSFVNVA